MKFKVMIFISSIILVSSTFATTVMYKNLNDLIDESEHVVGGMVLKIKAKKSKTGDIFTTITLSDAYAITEEGKTKTSKRMHIRYKGGEVDVLDKNNTVIGTESVFAYGTPELKVGDDVILFISHNGIADMPIYGWGQGLFIVGENNDLKDAKRNSIVGLDRLDLITKTSKGIKSNNPYIINDSLEYNSSVTELISSGQSSTNDRIISLKQSNDKIIKNHSLYSAMSVSEFISIIHEKKAIKYSKNGIPGKSMKNLHTLLPIGVQGNKVGIDIKNHKKDLQNINSISTKKGEK